MKYFLYIFIFFISLFVGDFAFAGTSEVCTDVIDNEFDPDFGQNFAYELNNEGTGFKWTANGNWALNYIFFSDLCRDSADDSGNIWVEISQTTVGNVIATSTINSAEFLQYESSANCESGMTFEFATQILSSSTIYYFTIRTTNPTVYVNYFDKANSIPNSFSTTDCSNSSCTVSANYSPGYLLGACETATYDEYYVLSDSCADFTAGYQTICYINEDCDVYVHYNSLTGIGTGFYYLDPDNPFKDEYLYYTDYSENQYMENHFDIPASHSSSFATGTIEEYCVLMDLPGSTGPDCLFGEDEITECGYSIKWVDRVEWEAQLQAEMDSAFAAHASNTLPYKRCEGLCTEETGFIACGMMKAFCWVLMPSASMLEGLNLEIAKAKGSFPINSISRIQSDLYEVASSTTEGFTIPYPMEFGGSGMSVSVSSSTASGFLGFELYGKLYDLGEKIVYFFGTIFLIFVLINSFKRNEQEI